MAEDTHWGPVDQGASAGPSDDVGTATAAGTHWGPVGDVGAPPAPKMSATSAFLTTAKKSALPTAAFIAGAEPGAAAGAGIGALGGPLDPITVPLGGIIGGIITGAPAALGVSKAQDYAVDKLPGVAKTVGIDPETVAQAQQDHPVAATLGELAPQALALRPSPTTVIDLLGKNGAAAAGKAVGKIAGGAAVAGGVDAAQQYAETGKVDPTELAAQTAMGGLLTEPWLLHGRVVAPGRAVTQGIIDLTGSKTLQRGAQSLGWYDTSQPSPTQSDQTSAEPTDLLQPTPQTPALHDALMGAIRTTETGDNPAQVSAMGAVGAHQLLPATAKQMADKLGIEFDKDRLLNDPDYNRELASAYMNTLLAHYNGDVFKAVTAYHAGPGYVDNWISRFGDPNDIGRDTWLQKVAAAGNPKSAQYPRDVFGQLGSDVSNTKLASDMPLPEPEMPKELSDLVSQAGISKVLTQSTLDDSSNRTVPASDVAKLSSRLSKALGRADVDKATDIVEGERAKLESQLDDLAQTHQDIMSDKDSVTPEQHASALQDVQTQLEKLSARDKFLTAAQAYVDHVHDQLGGPQQPATPQPQQPVTLRTVPDNPPKYDTLPKTPPAKAADTVLAKNLQHEAADSVSAIAKARQGVLDGVLGDAATRNPTARFVGQLKRLGLSAHIEPHEAERIARYEDVRAGFTDQSQPDFYREPSSPDESGNFGIPERQSGVTEEPRPEPVAPVAPQPAPEEVTANIRTRAETHADTLGSSRRAWFLRGVDHELGEHEQTPPTSKSKANWFEEGRDFVRQENEHQARERGDAGADTGADHPAVAAEPEPAEAAPRVIEKPSTKPMPTSRGGRDTFIRTVDAAVGTRITARDAQLLKIAEAAEVDHGGVTVKEAPIADLWRMFDNAVAENDKAGGIKARLGSPPERLRAMNSDQREQVRQGVEGWLRRELDKVGLHDVRVGAVTGDELARTEGDTALGRFINTPGFKPLIEVSIDQANPAATLRHEAIHALRAMDLFRPNEWSVLQRAAEKDGFLDWAREKYGDLPVEDQVEEAVAEMYAQRGQQSKPFVRRVLDKITRFLTALHNAFTRAGFKSAQDVMDAVAAGKIGARPRSMDQADVKVQTAYRKSEPGKADSKVQEVVDNLMNFSKTKSLWAFQTRDLAAKAAKTLPSAKDFVDALIRSGARSRQFDDRLADIKLAYEKLPQHVKGNNRGGVNDLLDDMTREQKWAFQPGWHPQVEVDADMAHRFNKLPAAAQEVVRNVLHYSHEMRTELGKVISQAITDEYVDQIAVAVSPEDRAQLEAEREKKLGLYTRMFDPRPDVPYAPRSRSGEFVAVGMSRDFIEAKRAGDADAMDAMREDPAHYWVRFYDSIGKAKAVRDRLTGPGKTYEFGDAFQRDKDSDLDLGGQDMHLAFNQIRTKLQGMLRDDPNNESVQKLELLARDMFLHALSENSARKAELRSFRVAGKDPVTGEPLDMMKAFVTRGRANSSFLSSLGSMREVQGAMERMRQESEALGGQPGNPREDAQRVKNELLWHYTHQLNRKSNRVVSNMLMANSLWSLMLKPTYYFQIAVQAPQFAVPHLAGVGGYGRAWHELIRGYGETRGLVKNWTQDRMDIRQMPDGPNKRLAEELQARGVLGQGMSMELGSWELNGNGLLPKAWNPIDRGLRQIPTNIEDVNRLSSAIAMYRIAKSKGAGEADAVNAAEKLILDAFGDYSDFATPKILKVGGEAMRIPLQYRKFQMIAATNQAKMFYNAFANADLTKEQLWVARRAFAWNMAHQVALAGIKGFPGAGIIGSVAMILAGGNAQDWDFEAKQKLDEFFGKGSMMADLLEKGAPYRLLKTDMTGTLGLDYLFSPIPNAQLPQSEAARSDYLSNAFEIAAGSAGNKLWNAIQGVQMYREGDLYRAMESWLPTGINNVMKAAQLGQRGLINRGGDTLMKPEDFTFLDQLKTAVGLMPADVSDVQDARGYVNDKVAQFEDKSTLLTRQYLNARREGDDAKLQKVIDAWNEMNAQRMAIGMLPAPMTNLAEAPAKQIKRQIMTRNGVPYTKSDIGFVNRVAPDTIPADRTALIDSVR